MVELVRRTRTGKYRRRAFSSQGQAQHYNKGLWLRIGMPHDSEGYPEFPFPTTVIHDTEQLERKE